MRKQGKTEKTFVFSFGTPVTTTPSSSVYTLTSPSHAPASAVSEEDDFEVSDDCEDTQDLQSALSQLSTSAKKQDDRVPEFRVVEQDLRGHTQRMFGPVTGTRIKTAVRRRPATTAVSFSVYPPTLLSSPQEGSTAWRKVDWTKTERSALVQRLSSYAPCSRDVAQARVLLVGPRASGKSSFISSVQSVFEGRVTNRAMVGEGQSSFTKKLQCFPLRAPDSTCAVELWDSMGFGDSCGPSLQQLLSVVKGHAPEGYEFRVEQALSSDTEGYIKRPGLREHMHCVAFVLDASKVSTRSYSKSTSAFLQHLRSFITDLGVHQVILLTHVDRICTKTQRDTSEVYNSPKIKETMFKAAELVGMSPSSVVPVRNYWCELELDLSSDVLLLRALELLLQYTDLYYREQQRATSKHDH